MTGVLLQRVDNQGEEEITANDERSVMQKQEHLVQIL